ncbi:hypothetical protein BCR32DRAFT_285480 [Anaeromyces robustus]|uniref:Uncharacterized protein n=1 Tax=Anaeromyces robustus TaxID=1754192 RepID=A0A1Y1WNM8_9FUNG|nr:hypothetical protein BCR32DRAFT_285480 [Anaeromyces robustus]|eukprot:ORX75123.1 hypothetical protein BCR32DRAFT_285480 [Anaeromyces robustus]
MTFGINKCATMAVKPPKFSLPYNYSDSIFFLGINSIPKISTYKYLVLKRRILFSRIIVILNYYHRKYAAIFNLTISFDLKINLHLKIFLRAALVVVKKPKSFSYWIFNCKAFEQNRNTILKRVEDLFMKFSLINQVNSLELSEDSDKDYEDNIYYLMLNVFLDGCYVFEKLEIIGEQSHSSESSVPDIVGLSHFLTFVMPIVNISFGILLIWYNNNKNTPGSFKGVDVEKIRHGIYSDTDSNDISFVEWEKLEDILQLHDILLVSELALCTMVMFAGYEENEKFILQDSKYIYIHSTFYSIGIAIPKKDLKLSDRYLGQDVNIRINARVAKIAKMVNNSCPNYCSCSCCSCCFQVIFIKELTIDNHFNSLYVTSDNSGVNNRINNIVKDYISSDNNGNNKISNNYPYKKKWKCLYKCQTESDRYSKSPFLLRSITLLNDIMPACLGQSSRANTDPITDPCGVG